MVTKNTNRKVLVIGVDGGTLDLIQPMVERGLAPTFSRLMRGAAWGALESSLPYISPVAWAAFMTGQNPAKNHILDFTFARPGSNQRLPVNATALRGQTLWKLLSDAGKKVGVINVPVTFPPQPVNGFLISGFPMPANAPQYTYPASLGAELESHGWNLADIAVNIPAQNERDAYLSGLYRRQEERTQATLWLMEHYEWDMMMVHIFEPDRIQHELFNYWAAHQAGQQDEQTRHYASELERFFQAVDQDLERLWRRLDEITPHGTLVVMSDHGFGPTHKAVHPYNLLLETGLMRLKPGLRIGLKRTMARAGLTPFNLYRILPQAVRRRLRAEADVSKVENKSGKSPVKLLRRLATGILLSFKDVDWQRTRAYCMGNSGMIQIFVNLQGREPHGAVPPDEYEATRDEIITALSAWRDPADDQPIAVEIYRREDIYTGPYLEEAADVLAVLRGDSSYYAFNGPMFLSNRSIDPRHYRQQANHRRNGIIFIKDERVAPGYPLCNAQIVDVAPTVLYMLGLPVPSDMDGTVLEECFTADWLQTHPPETIQIDETQASAGEPEPATGLTAEQEASMLQMLKDLGYVE